MRTIVDLPEVQLGALDRFCRREGISRAEAVRRAVATYIRRERDAKTDPAFGLWRDRAIDGLAYERELRRDWDGTPSAARRRTPRRGQSGGR